MPLFSTPYSLILKLANIEAGLGLDLGYGGMAAGGPISVSIFSANPASPLRKTDYHFNKLLTFFVVESGPVKYYIWSFRTCLSSMCYFWIFGFWRNQFSLNFFDFFGKNLLYIIFC